jgi:hypothetical protein
LRGGLIEDNLINFSHDQRVSDHGSETYDQLIGNFSPDSFIKMQGAFGAYDPSLINDNLINFPRGQHVDQDKLIGNSTEILGSGFLKNMTWEQFAPVFSPSQLTLGSLTQSDAALSGLGDAINAQNHYDLVHAGSEILSGSKNVHHLN